MNNGIIRKRRSISYAVIAVATTFLLKTAVLTAQIGPDNSFSKTAEKALKSVVSIESIKLVKTSDLRQFHLFRDDRDGEFDDEIPRIGGGSGFVVTSDGYILTNHHVVAGAERLKVTFLNHKVYGAKIVGLDSLTDLALLKVDAHNLIPVNFADSDLSKIGDWVIALGSPLGLEATVTAGIVSAKGRDINIVGRDLSAPTRGYAVENFIQTDAVINPGNSGGPLIDTNGKVIGVNTAIASRTGVYAGYGFAIPSNLARHVMDDLMEFGEVRRGYIGINIGNVDEDLAEYLKLDGVRGVIVNNFVQGGAAEKSDLKIGDVITHVDGKSVDRANALQAVIAGYAPREKILLTVVRGGRAKKISVVLREREIKSKPSASKSDDKRDKPVLGLLLENKSNAGVGWNPLIAVKNDSKQGVIVAKVKRRSAAAEKFIQKGDIIESLNGTPIGSVSEFERKLDKVKKGEIILLRIIRRNNRNFVALRYWGD